MIEVERLRKSFNSLVAVDDVSFTVGEGEIFGLLGPNGAGKTTTINMICGVLKPDGGRVLIGGKDIWLEPKTVKQGLAVVPQEIAVYEDMTARDNLNFWGSLYGLRGSDLKSRVDEALTRVGLSDRAGGQGQGLLGRHEEAAQPLHGPPPPSPGPAPRRAHGRHRPAGAAQHSRGRPRGRRLRHHRSLHHPLHGRGAGPLRPHRHHRPRQDPDRRHAGRAHASGRRGRGPAAQRVVRRRGRARTPRCRRRRPGAQGRQRRGRAVGRCRGPGLLAVLPKILEADLEVDDVSIQQPNLQSVFISLTGKELRD